MATRTSPPSTPAEHATINTTRCCIKSPTRAATNAVLCVKVQPHDVDSDEADSDVTFVETAMVVAMSGSVTPEPEYCDQTLNHFDKYVAFSPLRNNVTVHRI